jgi:hypothetical protein
MKTYEGVEVYLHVFLTSELDGVEWSVSRSGLINLGEYGWGITTHIQVHIATYLKY